MTITGVNYTVDIDGEELSLDYDKSTDRLFIDRNSQMISIKLADLETIISRIKSQVRE